MANIPEGKRSASFVLTEEVIGLIRAAQDGHRRIDGSRPIRVSDYVEDLLRRDMMAKGLLAMPVFDMPNSKEGRVKKKVSPARKSAVTKKKA